jgi:hypothetical protein
VIFPHTIIEGKKEKGFESYMMKIIYQKAYKISQYSFSVPVSFSKLLSIYGNPWEEQTTSLFTIGHDLGGCILPFLESSLICYKESQTKIRNSVCLLRELGKHYLELLFLIKIT